MSQKPTPRAVATGFVLSMALCLMNSYLTLSFGVIEEGPTIAALFFFAIFLVAKTRPTPHEMVIVATMGSAGGSLGFITNFYAAKAMTGDAFPFWHMVAFAVSTSLVGLVMVVPLKQLLIVKEKLPWPGSRAVESVIRALVEHGDPKQARILLSVTLVLIGVVIVNDDGGFGWLPAETPLPYLAAVGGAIAWSPFAIGGSYLMGLRTCVGFLFGGVALMILAPHLAEPSAPHRFYWPGLGFLVASGVVNLVRNWRSFVDALRSIGSLKGAAADSDPVMSGRAFIVFGAIAFVSTLAILVFVFGVPALLVLVLIVVGGFLQNVIATRAAAVTAFNPARVMGILLQGVTSLFGGSSLSVNLVGAGFVAGSGAQASVLTADLVYGRAFSVPSRHQFWTQLMTVIPCAVVSALTFSVTYDAKLPAPVAKMWAASAKIFDGTVSLPEGAVRWLIIGAAVGAVYVLVEAIPKLQRFVPESTGVGLGLVLSVSIDLSFFLGGVLLWIVLGRFMKWSEVTLTTIAVASIVAEGLGGVAKPLLSLAGVLK